MHVILRMLKYHLAWPTAKRDYEEVDTRTGPKISMTGTSSTDDLN